MPSHGALNGEKMGNLHQPQAGKQHMVSFKCGMAFQMPANGFSG